MSVCCLIITATGKLVEEEEGNLALWISYILTGVGANLVSWLVLPRNSVSVGASGAVFGLFTISVLVQVPGIVLQGSLFVYFLLCFHVHAPYSFTLTGLDVLGLEEDP